MVFCLEGCTSTVAGGGALNRAVHNFLQADQMHLMSFASEFNALQVARMVLVALWN